MVNKVLDAIAQWSGLTHVGAVMLAAIISLLVLFGCVCWIVWVISTTAVLPTPVEFLCRCLVVVAVLVSIASFLTFVAILVVGVTPYFGLWVGSIIVVILSVGVVIGVSYSAFWLVKRLTD